MSRTQKDLPNTWESCPLGSSLTPLREYLNPSKLLISPRGRKKKKIRRLETSNNYQIEMEDCNWLNH